MSWFIVAIVYATFALAVRADVLARTGRDGEYNLARRRAMARRYK